MSRRIPKAATETEAANGEGQLPGGAAGVIPEASQKIHFAGETEGGPGAPPTEASIAVRPTRYRVDGPGPNRDGTWPCLYGGLRIDLKPGKVFDTASYDVEKIRAQGVKVTELAD
jgi:hypothetical protein